MKPKKHKKPIPISNPATPCQRSTLRPLTSLILKPLKQLKPPMAQMAQMMMRHLTMPRMPRRLVHHRVNLLVESVCVRESGRKRALLGERRHRAAAVRLSPRLLTRSTSLMKS